MNTFDRLLNRYMDRFINRTDIWGKQWVRKDGRGPYACQSPDMDTMGGRFIYEPVTPDLVRRHFMGEISCAWSATDQNCCSRWLCFDSDHDDGKLDRLETALKSWGLHTIREGRRPGRAGHLWILFDAPVQAELLIVLGDAMMRLAGVSGLERFPKTATGISLVRGPLGINLKPDANFVRGVFDGAEPTLKAQLEWLEVQPLNSAEDAVREAKRHMPIRAVVPKALSPRSGLSYGTTRFGILDHVYARQVGNELVAQCPLCAIEGHDRHRDNLRIKPDGSVFCCVFGGPGQVHKAPDIIAELRQQ